MRALRIALAAACLATVLATAPVSADLGGPEPGPFTGTIGQDHTRTHHFSTHGDNPCLAVYMPRVYTVTLAYAPPTDTLSISVGGLTDVGSLGAGSISFVANYCTAFDITVVGVEVTDKAAYGVTVTSVPLLPVTCDC